MSNENPFFELFEQHATIVVAGALSHAKVP